MQNELRAALNRHKRKADGLPEPEPEKAEPVGPREKGARLLEMQERLKEG